MVLASDRQPAGGQPVNSGRTRSAEQPSGRGRVRSAGQSLGDGQNRSEGRPSDRGRVRSLEQPSRQSRSRSVEQSSHHSRSRSVEPLSSHSRTRSAVQLPEQGSARSGSQPAGRQTGRYVYGNAAQQLDVQREMEQQPRRMSSNATRKNREKARHMNFGYLAFLVLAMCVAGYVLIHYIRLQADITTATERIASQEKELNNLRVANDEELSRITSGVDMEEVKRVAIGVLGMVYPQEGQIVTYSNEGQDYVRKVDEGN